MEDAIDHSGKTWLTYLDDSKTMKQKTGRGELKIIEKKQKAEEEERRSKGHRSKWHHKAVEKLRQARRCEEAVSHRHQRQAGEQGEAASVSKAQWRCVQCNHETH